MVVPKSNYLQGCFQAFREVIEKKYGRVFDLSAIEKSVKHLRRDTPLSYKDLQHFESPQHWWFEKFWVFPPEHQVTPGLKRRKFNFWGLPDNEKEVIGSLFEVFRSIELVSIILRFIRPEYYGIISPPVERVLDVQRGSEAVETYLNYLNDLRHIQKQYHLDRVADADMALWVIHERCYGTLCDPDVEKAYFSDRFLLQLRAKNLLLHFFQRYSYGALASALLPVNPELAAQIGGIAFERMVRKKLQGMKSTRFEDQDLKTLIDQLRSDGRIDELTLGRWHAARRTRNKAIHAVTLPTLIEVKQLLQILDEDRS